MGAGCDARMIALRIMSSWQAAANQAPVVFQAGTRGSREDDDDHERGPPSIGLASSSSPSLTAPATGVLRSNNRFRAGPPGNGNDSPWQARPVLGSVPFPRQDEIMRADASTQVDPTGRTDTGHQGLWFGRRHTRRSSETCCCTDRCTSIGCSRRRTHGVTACVC